VTIVRTVKLGEWEFWVEDRPWGLYFSVPDRGGMMDSLPRVPEQLEWAEAVFAELPALKQIWTTTWELPPEALPDVRALIERSGGTWDEIDVQLEHEPDG
jgi:hypothetical protein